MHVLLVYLQTHSLLMFCDTRLLRVLTEREATFPVKIFLHTYQVFNNQSLSYLKDFIVSYFPNRTICSHNAGLLVVPRILQSRMGG